MTSVYAFNGRTFFRCRPSCKICWHIVWVCRPAGTQAHPPWKPMSMTLKAKVADIGVQFTWLWYSMSMQLKTHKNILLFQRFSWGCFVWNRRRRQGVFFLQLNSYHGEEYSDRTRFVTLLQWQDDAKCRLIRCLSECWIVFYFLSCRVQCAMYA